MRRAPRGRAGMHDSVGSERGPRGRDDVDGLRERNRRGLRGLRSGAAGELAELLDSLPLDALIAGPARRPVRGGGERRVSIFMDARPECAKRARPWRGA
jgi:hypothetical protein